LGLRIFGFENEKVIGKRRRLQKEELYDLYSTLIIIQVIAQRKMRWVGHVACIADRSCIQGLVRKPEGKRPL
jgi:hypothetical protein